MNMLWQWQRSALVVIIAIIGISGTVDGGAPHRILLDTDIDTADFFAILYLLKLNRSEFDFQAITINTNAWTNAGHAANQVYDILYMMGRDDVSVGMGGEGGILEDGTIQPNVGGYIPIIDQGIGTAGPCRYRQAIPVGAGGRLDIDTNYGFRKSFLPQGSRRYSPLRQPTAQQVLIEKVSMGPISVLITGAHTNFAIFLLSNPHLKKNVEHIYIMGGGVRSKNPTGCCPKNASSSCQPQQCGDHGNMFTAFKSNPYAEFNFFGDPFAAYQVIHSGIPITLVPLDATNTIPVTQNFFEAFEQNQRTYEAQYIFKSLKMTPKFNLTRNGVHSGRVQTGIQDPFCLRKNKTGRCKDGYTDEISGPDSVRVLVATRAKPNRDKTSSLDREFYIGFLDVLNQPQQSGRFNFTSEFPYYKEVLYKPDFRGKQLGKTVVFDMDMSAGDFLVLFYLLKVPVEEINLKAILVTPTGWANAATIDVIYDLLHMMGRDDIAVGLGDPFGLNQSYPDNPIVGNCKYTQAVPHGGGGLLDSDTLYGLARVLPRSPRRYTSENSVEFGAPRNTDYPQLRQPLALEVWESVAKSIDPGSKITILTNGPLTNLAKIILSDANASSKIQDVYIVGGHVNYNNKDKGNVINVPSNKYSELNMFLDSVAAKTVFDSSLKITLIPLGAQRTASAFPKIIERVHRKNKTPEALFIERLLTRLYHLQQKHHRYRHMDTFLGEILGAVILTDEQHILNSTFQVTHLKVHATGVLSKDGQVTLDGKKLKPFKVLEKFNHELYYDMFANRVADERQSAVIGSFEEQKRSWSTKR